MTKSKHAQSLLNSLLASLFSAVSLRNEDNTFFNQSLVLNLIMAINGIIVNGISDESFGLTYVRIRSVSGNVGVYLLSLYKGKLTCIYDRNYPDNIQFVGNTQSPILLLDILNEPERITCFKIMDNESIQEADQPSSATLLTQ